MRILLCIVPRILEVWGLRIVHGQVPRYSRCLGVQRQESRGGFVECRVIGQDRRQEKLCVPL